MSLTNDQLLERIEAIEITLNTIQSAMNNLVTKAQMKALLNIRQGEIDQLQARVTSLESRVDILEQS